MANVMAPYFSNQALNCMLRATLLTAPTALYLAAFNGDPLGAGSELASTGSYARIAIPAYSVSGNTATNTAVATWPTATASWTTPWDHIGLFDSGTHGAGNLWWSGSLAAARTVIAPNTPVNQIGQLALGFGTGMGPVFGANLLNALVAATNVAIPGSMRLAPFNGDPLAGGSELTTNGASRLVIPTFSAASGGSITNTSSVNWGAASADWVANCTHLAYLDNTGGAIWIAQPLTVTQVVLDGDIATVPIGGLVISFN